MEPVHVAITRLVQPGKEAAFEKAMYAFIERSIGVHGVTGVHLLRPAPGADSREYGILRSFESREARDAFYASEALRGVGRGSRAPGGERVQQARAARARSFLPARGGQRHSPPRWKMALLTWMGVFPSVVVWSAILRPRSTPCP
jgi:antibiotic biosynthesis monooxygenase (ABM) superfamily enzyme